MVKSNSLTIDTIINYLNKGYLTLVTVIFSPLLYSYFGEEGFGVISIFLTLQIWFLVLDAGLSNSLSRECAKYKNSPNDSETFHYLVRCIRLFYLFLIPVLLLVGILNADSLILIWFSSSGFSHDTLHNLLLIIMVTVIFRLCSLPFKSVLIGFSLHKLTAVIEIIFASMSFPLNYMLVYFFKLDLFHFFVMQLLSTTVFVLSLAIYARANILKEKSKKYEPVLSFSKIEFRGSIALAFQIFVGALVWLLLSQFDKFILSRELTTSEYGVYFMAIQVSSIVMTLSAPFSQALLPKLVGLYELGRLDSYNKLFLNSFIFLASILIPISIFISVYSKEIFIIWTGSHSISDGAHSVASKYIIGNLFFALSSFSYYVLFTQAKLRLHTTFSLVSILFILPSYTIAINSLGDEGAAWVWMIYNIASFIVWFGFIVVKFCNRQTLFFCYLSAVVFSAFSFLFYEASKRISFLFDGYFVIVFWSLLILISIAVCNFINPEIRLKVLARIKNKKSIDSGVES